MYRLWSVVSLYYHSLQRGRNALLLCAMKGHLAVAEYIAPKMEGHLFDSDVAGYTALHWAAHKGQLSMVKYLVRTCGFDVKARGKVGLHCLLLVWCVLCPLWTHLLHGHSRHGHLYLSCVNLFIVCIINVTTLLLHVCSCTYVHDLMWYTTSRYVSPIRFHCVSLTSCAVGVHPTYESCTERPWRSFSVFACKKEQCAGTEQCGLTKGSVVFLWSSDVVCWSLCSTWDSSSNPMKCKVWPSSVVRLTWVWLLRCFIVACTDMCLYQQCICKSVELVKWIVMHKVCSSP